MFQKFSTFGPTLQIPRIWISAREAYEIPRNRPQYISEDFADLLRLFHQYVADLRAIGYTQANSVRLAQIQFGAALHHEEVKHRIRLR